MRTSLGRDRLSLIPHTDWDAMGLTIGTERMAPMSERSDYEDYVWKQGQERLIVRGVRYASGAPVQRSADMQVIWRSQKHSPLIGHLRYIARELDADHGNEATSEIQVKMGTKDELVTWMTAWPWGLLVTTPVVVALSVNDVLQYESYGKPEWMEHYWKAQVHLQYWREKRKRARDYTEEEGALLRALHFRLRNYVGELLMLSSLHR